MAKTIGLYSLAAPTNLAALASGATNTDQEIASFVAPHDMKLAAAYIAFIAAMTGAGTTEMVAMEKV